MKELKTIAIAVATIAGTATLGIATLFAAQAPNAERANPMTRFVTAIAEKFNLNVSDVQAVVDEQRQAMRTEQQAKMAEQWNERLAQAVANGKLTQAQADLIAAKHAEMQATAEGMKDLDQDERAAAMKAKSESLKAWAEENDIPEQYVTMFGFGRGMMGGQGRMGGQEGGRGGRMMDGAGQMGGGMHGAFGAKGGEKASQ